MNIFVVSASHRRDSQSGKVAKFIQTELESQGTHKAELLDLGKTPLPLWDEGVWQGSAVWQEAWGPVQRKLLACEGIVLVTPEWAGMAAPAMKNFLLLCGVQEVGHKPGLIVAVSAAKGGAYPIAELKAFGSKNNHLCFIPEHVIVRNVEHVLLAAEASSEEDTRTRTRLKYGLDVLLAYAKALSEIRASGVLELERFKNGM